MCDSALQWAAAEADPDAEADSPKAPAPAPVEILQRWCRAAWSVRVQQLLGSPMSRKAWIQARIHRKAVGRIVCMHRLNRLLPENRKATVPKKSCSLPELSDFHGAWFYQMGLRTFRGNNVAIFEDDKRSAITGQPEHHKVVEQANANAAANGIPLDPGLDPRFATHRDAQQRLDPNNSASPTPLLDDFSSGAGAGASGESASASGSASAAAH